MNKGQILSIVNTAVEESKTYKESVFLVECIKDPCGCWEIEYDSYGEGYNIHYSHEGVLAFLGNYRTPEEVVPVVEGILNGNITDDDCCW